MHKYYLEKRDGNTWFFNVEDEEDGRRSVDKGQWTYAVSITFLPAGTTALIGDYGDMMWSRPSRPVFPIKPDIFPTPGTHLSYFKEKVRAQSDFIDDTNFEFIFGIICQVMGIIQEEVG